MNVNVRVSSLVVFLLLCSAGGASAQMSGPDEAIGSKGRHYAEIGTFVRHRGARFITQWCGKECATSSRGITAVVGAPVPPSVPLFDLPEQPQH